jgi:hypothetical protein
MGDSGSVYNQGASRVAGVVTGEGESHASEYPGPGVGRQGVNLREALDSLHSLIHVYLDC